MALTWALLRVAALTWTLLGITTLLRRWAAGITLLTLWLEKEVSKSYVGKLKIDTNDEHSLDLRIDRVVADMVVGMIDIVLGVAVVGMTDMRRAQAIGLETGRAETDSSVAVENVVLDTGSVVGIAAAVDLPMLVAGRVAARLKVEVV